MLHNTSSISSSSLPFSLFFPLLHLRPGCRVWSRLRQRNTAITQSRWGSVGVSCIHEACEKHTLSSVSRWDFFSVSALFYSSFTFSFLQQSLCLFHPALLSTPLKCRPSPPFLLSCSSSISFADHLMRLCCLFHAAPYCSHPSGRTAVCRSTPPPPVSPSLPPLCLFRLPYFQLDPEYHWHHPIPPFFNFCSLALQLLLTALLFLLTIILIVHNLLYHD